MLLIWHLRVTGARRRAYNVPRITWDTNAPQKTPTLSQCRQQSWSVERRVVTTRPSGNSSSATFLSSAVGLPDAFQAGLAILWTQTT